MYHAGKDGWLFLTGGTNEVADQIVTRLALYARHTAQEP